MNRYRPLIFLSTPRLGHLLGPQWELFISRKVSEGLVGSSHLMHIFPLLEGGTGLIAGIQEFLGQFLGHRLAFPGSAGANDPSDGQSHLAFGVHLDWNLVHGTANASGADLGKRLHVLERLVENGDWVGFALIAQNLHRVVEDSA